MKLAGKNALVTGATKGIGRAIALAFAKEGAGLIVTGRNTSELTSLEQEVRGLGGVCHTVAADLAEPEAASNVWDFAKQAGGDIHILVNNAGMGSSAKPMLVAEYDDEFWTQMLYVNLTVPYILIRKALPEMIQRQHGRIINVASINGKIPSVYGCAYAASKHGLLGLTKTVAVENVGHGITANSICPGPVATLLNDIRVQFDAEQAGRSFEEQEKTMTGLGRRLVPEEIAPLAVYLASDDAATMTGQSLNIDAGICMAA